MSYNLPSDARGGAAPGLPGISAAALHRLTRWSVILTVLVFLFLLLWWARSVYTDWLWFDNLGLRSVYAKILVLKVWLFVGGTVVAAVVLSLNFYLALRFSRGPSILPLTEDRLRLLRATVLASAALTVMITSPIFGAVAHHRWETFLLLFNKVPFGVSDPQFGLEISFYVVTLRLLHFIQGWLLGLIITVIVTSLLLYFMRFSVRGIRLILTPRMLRHVALVGVFLMLNIAVYHALHVYELVLSDKGIVPGLTYTGVNARIPVLWFMTGIATLSALGFGVSIYFGGLRLIVGAFSLWVIMVLLAGLTYPALFQRLRVDPDQFAKERPYILRNLEATRTAYQLDGIREASYPAQGKLDAQAVQNNRQTLDNIRLWDLGPMQDAYNQLQFIQLYYSFLNMDVDRYVVNGQLRQVLVSAREISPDNLPPEARNWVNQKLQYTHGYGIAMSTATGFSRSEGRPEFLLRDIPIQGYFKVVRPELYYGEAPSRFAIVDTATGEVDPNTGLKHYDGSGDVAISSAARRLAYAWQFADINILLSDQITPQSRIQYRRQIKDRVSAIAPFLNLDRDPYPVLDDSGKLWWLQDAYTTTDRYPYSTPLEPKKFNYIRNSVKVAVDAYNGSVRFYVVQPEDPLIKMYRQAFPTLFEDFEAMPPALRDHIRYPSDLFSAQSRMYLRYHITDPQVFFNQAEQWAVPMETRFGKRGGQLTPYYLVMQLPGADKAEFVLILPFTPAGDKKNLVGWLTARSDWPHYGELLSFQLPRDRQIDGPSQVEARIENNPVISQQFSLWEGAGSKVIRGNLLVIPIAETIIYAEPLYLQSQVLAFPELKKVILADASNLVMADTINEGLDLLVGGVLPQKDRAPEASRSGGPQPEELTRLEDAIRGLRQALDALQKSLDNLRKSSGGSSP